MSVMVREKEKGSGVFWIFINHEGQRKSVKIGGKKAAKQAQQKIEHEIALGKLDLAKKQMPTFKKYSDLWLESYIKPLRRLSTYNRYKDLLEKHVCPEPRWPLENPPPVAGSKSPTLRQQNGCKLIQFLF